jgi:heme exporter protein B
VIDLQHILTIAKKDFLQELRSKAVTVATLFFATVVIGILAFALGPDKAIMQRASAGVMWIALAFAGIISATQSYQNELEESAFEQLLIYPIPRFTIYIGKLLANWLYMIGLGFLIVPVTALLFNAPLTRLPWLFSTIALGTLGFALIATFYAALTANLRARESLLPVLTFPIIVPILQAAVRATNLILGQTINSGDIDPGNQEMILSWLQLLLGFDLVYGVVCIALFHYLVEE